MRKRSVCLLLILGLVFSSVACGKVVTPKILTCKNAVYGYQLTFPEAWRGFYETEETEDGSLFVYFSGKSKTSKHARSQGDMLMFMIVSDAYVQDGNVDVVQKAGEASGTELYWATTTDMPAELLFNVAHGVGIMVDVPFRLDEDEIAAAKTDFSRWVVMLGEVAFVLRGFGE